MHDAACKGVGPEIFFPNKGGGYAEAVSYCDNCPVEAECYDYSERSGSNWGVWGGEIKRRGEPRPRKPPRVRPINPPAMPPHPLVPPD